jgi:tetratricopeptide (TPR) repeat protein
MILREDLVAELPENADGIWARYELADVQQYLGALLMETGHDREGERLLRCAIEAFDKLTADFPDKTDYRARLASACERLGEALWAAGRTDEAEQLIQRALVLRERLAADFPSSLSFAANLLHTLSKCPAPRFCDLPRAVEIAAQCVWQHPDHEMAWLSLGAAHYRTGNWQAAVDALGQWLELPGAAYRWPCFYLAMAYWQLGDELEARHWYDEALEWMENNQPTPTRLDDLRAEAAELLGIDELPTAEEQAGPSRDDER